MRNGRWKIRNFSGGCQIPGDPRDAASPFLLRQELTRAYETALLEIIRPGVTLRELLDKALRSSQNEGGEISAITRFFYFEYP
jgi:hypothetical protein